MKVAFLDLETSNLNANFGRILCGCIKPLGKPVQSYRQDFDQDAEYWDDSKTVAKIHADLHGYDLVVGWYSTYFDVPFLRTRALHLKLPQISPFHLDLWMTCRRMLKLNSNRLASAQAFLRLPDAKTPLDPDDWSRATAGDTRVYNKIVKHCEQDVKVLEQAYEKLLPYVRSLTSRVAI